MSDLHQTYNFMIRKFKETDLTDIMQLWLKANIEVHNFIPTEYWTDNYDITSPCFRPPILAIKLFYSILLIICIDC